MPGPAPKPTALRVLEGNRGKHKLNRAEPLPANFPEPPPPPPGLSSEARDEWARQAPQLHRLGLLTVIDLPAFAAYCVAFARWQTAEQALADMAKRDPTTSALMIRTSKGTLIQNPLVGTARRAAIDMVRYAAEFGMTPAARSRIQAGTGTPIASEPLALLYQV